MLCFNDHISLSAQNGVNPDWEKKVIEYFKEKLKENNAPKWVSLLLFAGREGELLAIVCQWNRNPIGLEVENEYKLLLYICIKRLWSDASELYL